MENLRRITVLTDTPSSWIVSYAVELIRQLNIPAYRVRHVHYHDDIPKGEILVALSCEHVIPPHILERNESNITVHPSALPKGRGWSPLAWQVLEGAERIPITLFEMRPDVDTGEVYIRDEIMLDGRELNEDIKRKQGEATVRMVLRYIENYPMPGEKQQGTPTWYPRRTAADSEIDIDKTIREQFDLLRVVDNERYPAFFELNGGIYTLRIEREC